MLNHDLTVKINVRDNIPLDQSDKPLWARIPFYFYFFGAKMLPEGIYRLFLRPPHKFFFKEFE